MSNPELPTFKFVHVRCTRPDSLVVRWVLNPHGYPLDKIAFEVFRSQGPNGPWDLIGEADTGTFTYYDLELEGPMGLRMWYYRVRVADIDGKGYVDSQPVYLAHDPDNIALEMIRKKNVFMQTTSGIAIAILLRKQWGSKCTRCWDGIRMLPKDDDCPLCFGTGYNGGFCTPVMTFGIIPSPFTRMLARTLGRLQPNEEYFELTSQTWVNPDDILIDRTIGARYHVNRVVQNTHRGYPVSLLGTATKLDDNSIIHTIQIPEDPASIGGASYDAARVAK